MEWHSTIAGADEPPTATRIKECKALVSHSRHYDAIRRERLTSPKDWKTFGPSQPAWDPYMSPSFQVAMQGNKLRAIPAPLTQRRRHSVGLSSNLKEQAPEPRDRRSSMPDKLATHSSSKLGRPVTHFCRSTSLKKRSRAAQRREATFVEETNQHYRTCRARGEANSIKLPKRTCKCARDAKALEAKALEVALEVHVHKMEDTWELVSEHMYSIRVCLTHHHNVGIHG